MPDKDGNLTEAEKEAIRKVQDDLKKENEEYAEHARREGERN